MPRPEGTGERVTSTNESRCSASSSSCGSVQVPHSWSETVEQRNAQSPLWVRYSPHTATLRVGGVIDESTRTLFTAALARATASTRDTLHIDLAEVGSCDLPGLRTIVSLARHAAPAKRVRLGGLPPEIGTILHILGWDATLGLAVQPIRPGRRPDPDIRACRPGMEREA